MRVCIVGGGLAGSLLAWRLAQVPGGLRVELRVNRATDATAVSGGAVKAFEAHPRQRELATESLTELLTSPVLRMWSGFRQETFLSFCANATTDELAEAVAPIDAVLPGTTELITGDRLPASDWVLPGPRTVVVERHTGYTTPGSWRDRVIEDCLTRGVSIVDGWAGPIRQRHDGTVRCGLFDYDLVVLATGPWTPHVLRANGFPTDGYRTKSIQYALHACGSWRPPSFSDAVTGLYARPTAASGLLVGLPTSTWNVDPEHPPLDEDLLDRAAGQLTAMLPRLRLGPVTAKVAAADCYREEPVLGLGAVQGAEHLLTFTGGAGGSVKTALAASRAAAEALTEPARHPSTVGRRKGQP